MRDNDKNTEYQATHRERRKKRGDRRIYVWLPGEDIETLDSLCKQRGETREELLSRFIRAAKSTIKP